MTKSIFLPELDAFRWGARSTHIIYDSDVAEKPRVEAAEERLATELRNRGALVRKVRLPDSDDGRKVGVDDYLLEYSSQDLVSLVNQTPLEGESYTPPLPFSQLLNNSYPDIYWAWSGLVLQGEVNLLYGNGGVGKSLLALYLAMSVASGRPLLGHPVQQMPVLGLFAEDGEREVQRRMRQIMDQDEAFHEDLPIRLWCQPSEDTVLAIVDDNGVVVEQPRLFALRSELARLGQPALVILDGFADLFALNENLRLPVNAALKRVLGSLCRDYDATIVVLAHPSKASMNDGTHYSGSTAFNNGVRQRLTLERKTTASGANEDELAQRTLKVSKSNYGSNEELDMWFYGYDIEFMPRGPSTSPEEKRNAILKVMLELIDNEVRVINRNGAAGDARTLSDFTKTLNERTGMKLRWQEVKDELRRLQDDGFLSYQEADKSSRPHKKAAFKRGIRSVT